LNRDGNRRDGDLAGDGSGNGGQTDNTGVEAKTGKVMVAVGAVTLYVTMMPSVGEC